MKTLTILFSAVAVSVLFVACEDKTPQVSEKPTAETANVETTRLGSAIDTYIRTPNNSQSASVDEAFAELDGEIAELDRQVAGASGEQRSEAKAKADNLREYRDKERVRYTEAQARARAQAVKEETAKLGDRVEEGAKRAGEGVKDAAEAVKDSAENAVDAVRGE